MHTYSLDTNKSMSSEKEELVVPMDVSGVMSSKKY